MAAVTGRDDPQASRRARLLTLADGIDAVMRGIGEWIAWLALAMVLVTFAVVLLRYAFDLGSISLQESVTYMHAVLFMLGIAYTLGRNGHVRVDIFYERLSRRGRAWVDLIGTLVLLFPVCVLILWLGWDYVAESWRVQEASREAGGIPAVYLLKTLILIMPVLLMAQGLAQALRNGLFLAGVEEALPGSEADSGHA
ncbi:MAG: TRAP transporter small permease subunit [Thiocapsa sp.]|nr:TRAP transporter small permease subunit [Thiocapsa sp.]MCG6896956.1 TRAP transporter small permease subunit [Thiocapsa sp.]MCG6985282.1 TRAP transporter small permease subunit [Thiocapsa sp.]